MIKLFTTEITDKWIRENFRRLQDLIRGESLLQGNYKFFEFTVKSGDTKLPHNLGFMPKDVITIYVSDGATVTWNYEDFTKETIDLTASADCTVRAYIGHHKESVR